MEREVLDFIQAVTNANVDDKHKTELLRILAGRLPAPDIEPEPNESDDLADKVANIIIKQLNLKPVEPEPTEAEQMSKLYPSLNKTDEVQVKDVNESSEREEYGDLFSVYTTMGEQSESEKTES